LESRIIMAVPFELRVASYNIHKAVGTDRRRDPARIGRVIAEIGADILALQEADMRFGNRQGLLDLVALQKDLGLIPIPNEGIGPSHGFHGNLLLVRNALVEDVHRLILPGLEPRGALVADLNLSGRPLRVIAAHMGLLPQSRKLQARAILNKIGALDGRPSLLMGDLNEWRSGARSSLSHLSNHFSSVPVTRSFPARYPLFALDRVMACDQAELLDLEAHDSPLARIASDHLPIRATFRFRED
jgi:endonuclease/exonuclease/phosphatase family metal-dependent hydrolase